MQRTRKFTHLGPEARRLAARGVSTTTIAAELGVHRSTVHRWTAAGRLAETPGAPVGDALVPVADIPAPQWAAAMRALYLLDATDVALVDLAAFALSVNAAVTEPASVRLLAAGRFQSIVKQLAARVRPVESTTPTETPTRTPRADPRALLNPTVQ